MFRSGEPVSLGRRAVALLRVLVEQRGIPVSKDALMDAAWAGLTVGESNLTVQIAALRQVLGEEPGGDNWIETLPRRGYRFVGPASARDQGAVTAASQATNFPMAAGSSNPTLPEVPPSPFCRFRTSARTLNKNTSPMAWSMKSSRRCHAFRRCLSSRGTPASLTRAGPST